MTILMKKKKKAQWRQNKLKMPNFHIKIKSKHTKQLSGEFNRKCGFGFGGWVMAFILVYFIECHLLCILIVTEVHWIFAFRQTLEKRSK